MVIEPETLIISYSYSGREVILLSMKIIKRNKKSHKERDKTFKKKYDTIPFPCSNCEGCSPAR